MSQIGLVQETKTTELPPELELKIAEWAARASRPCAVRLALVGRRFREWVEPIIYETVVLGANPADTVTTTMFLRTLRLKPAGFLAGNVKNIYLTSAIASSQAVEILSTCTGATNITCWAIPNANDNHLMALYRRNSLRRLSSRWDALHEAGLVNLTLAVQNELSITLFDKLSHLDIVNSIYDDTTIDWTWLHALPALTHLAFGDLFMPSHQYLFDVFSQLLSECKFLKALVILSSDEHFPVELEKRGWHDPRVILLPNYHYPKSPQEYWQNVQEGGFDFWEFADWQIMQKGKPGSTPEEVTAGANLILRDQESPG